MEIAIAYLQHGSVGHDDESEETLMFMKVQPEMTLDSVSHLILGDVERARKNGSNDLDKLMSFEHGADDYLTKPFSGSELLAALRANWVGYEPLYALVNSSHMHQYGNDDDYADELAKFAIGTYCKHVEHRPTAHGGEFMPGVYSVTANVQHGVCTPASPDGRYAGEPLSDCMGPVHTQCCSHDHSGPTAIANSVAKLEHSRIANGIILNWKFAPGTVSGETGRDNLIGLMDVYFEKQGMQSQFSIVGKETMICAQQHPEDYKDLLVRIAGYSAYFVELSRELQDDLIGRTELSFD